MPAQITSYKCPSCTAPLHYSAASGQLECEFCGSSYSVEEIEMEYAEKEESARQAFEEAENPWDQSEMSDDWGEDAQRMRAYSCPSCGAELICEETTAATACPYCGNTAIVPGQFSGALRPDYVLPFRLDKNAAVAAIKLYYKGKRLLPSTFSKSSRIDKIQGIYVPFWMFDGEVTADVKFHATRTHSHRSGDYEVIQTQHFDVSRSGVVSFERIPVDASRKLPDDYMDSIEPYDYSDLKPFSNVYLPGFLADKYDVSVEESTKRADKRAENTAVDKLREDVTGYSGCTELSRKISLKRGKVSYAMLPVYLLNISWKEKKFLFAVNGQTGKVSGNLPISWLKFWAWLVGLSIGLTIPLTILAAMFF